MTVALALLAVLVIALFVFGFTVHVLWWLAIAALVLFVLGLVLRGGRPASRV